MSIVFTVLNLLIFPFFNKIYLKQRITKIFVHMAHRLHNRELMNFSIRNSYFKNNKDKKMNFSRLLCALVFSWGLTIGVANATVIDFESLSDGTSVDNAYAGLTFSNAMVLSAGVSLNEFEFPPQSGQNVAFDNGGEVTIDFAAAITQFSAYFTYLTPVTITAFDSAMNVVGSGNSAFLSNLALSGDLGSLPNELLQVSYASGISRIVLAGDPSGASFVFDDMTYITANQIPEPSVIFLLLAGMLVYWGFRIQVCSKLKRPASASR